MKIKKLVVALAAVGFTTGAYATNGMNLEGYGPIAAGMGGASFAYDNGTAAVMNNPATLSLAGNGSRLDLALGYLGPKVAVEGGQKSDGTAYFMPAMGWVKKSGDLSYGAAMFAQGGMGTEYAMGLDGKKDRSELGVGRMIFPLSYSLTKDFAVGASADFVWAMMDIKMAMPASSMLGMMTPGSGTGAFGLFNTVSTLNDLASALGISLDPLMSGRVDASDDSDYTGKAKTFGYAGKLGFTFKLSDKLTLGGTYHSKTRLKDMKTSRKGAQMVITAAGIDMPTDGKLIIHDFQWPETYGLGLALKATDHLMFAFDVKRIGWKSVMKNFSMTFTTSDALGSGQPGSVDFVMPQNWDDQTVYSLGGSYKLSDALTLRAGVNMANNPIPDATMNYLFPAIVKNHLALGLGYAFSPESEMNLSVQYAPKVTQTNPDPNGDGDSTDAYTVSHSQTSAQLMYSARF